MQWPYPLSPSSTAPNFLTNIPDLPLSFLLLFCQPRMCQTARYIWSGLPHQPSFLPSSTWFYHILPFFFFKVLSVYLTFQAISSRCSFKESRLVLTKFKGKNGCLEYPIHNFLVDFDPLFSDIRLKKFTKPPFSSVFTRFVWCLICSREYFRWSAHRHLWVR